MAVTVAAKARNPTDTYVCPPPYVSFAAAVAATRHIPIRRSPKPGRRPSWDARLSVLMMSSPW